MPLLRPAEYGTTTYCVNVITLTPEYKYGEKGVGRGASPFKSCIEDTGLSFVAKMPLCFSVGANARAREVGQEERVNTGHL